MRVTHLRDHTPSVRELFLRPESPDQFQFRAGQFVTLHVPDPEAGKPALRAYSIASEEQNTQGFRLLFKFVPGGKASRFVWDLKGDELLQMTGPFGRVFFQEPPTDQVIFFNTGTGISQHFSYLTSKAQNYPSKDYRLYFGVRSEEEIYFEDELRKLKKNLPNFHYEFVLSRASDCWEGRRGYVQSVLQDLDYLQTPTTFYLCGNGGMIKETKEILSKAAFDSKKIFSEAFD